ncbi:hypothetical protein [Cytobacillus firmus]|uniref:hypothetical protein n=1 Tax=Cytobacillus firmus TaxID=1399 RepID=UPI0018CDEA07|nr:hypothetical protein [Cytobacillus firmus]MBG9587390.1 hypothetical protein [Cytobacillus firmus]
MKCPNCSSTNLFHYTEKQQAIHRKITKNNTISKIKPYEYDVSYAMPDYIQCEDCDTTYDYEEADNGKVSLICENENPYEDKYA